MKIIISGGGTGGHIYPAISIADALNKKYPDSEILFVGAEGRMEMEKVPKSGYNIIALPVIGLKRKISFSIITFFWKLLLSIIKSRKIIKRHKPDYVVGVGGYASGPLLWAASRKNIPCLIQEQNSYPGITNKILSRYADKICVAYPGLEKYFPADKIVFTGNPVREDIINIKPKSSEAINHFNLSSDKPVVLAVGGSLGAKTINQALSRDYKKLVNNNIQLIWQTGKSGYKMAVEAAGKNQENIFINKFIYRMDYAYSVADIVISRAGASTISELCLVGKPAVFVPSPNVAEDHQKKNAMALVNKEAAIMVEDDEAVEKLVDKVTDLMNNKERQEKMIRNIKDFGKKASADIIADELIKIRK